MKIALITLGLSALLATSALAQPGNNGGGNGGCGVGQQTNGCGGTTQPPVHNYSPHFNQGQLQGQAQGQLQAQGQAQGQQQRSTNINGNRNTNRNSVVGNNRNVNRNNVASHSTSSSVSSASSRSVNAGNHQSMSYHESRQRLQAPGLAASFSSVQGSPCEGVPVGLGATVPGFGGMFQLPRESRDCWSERKALVLISTGCVNAGLAALAGNPVDVALANNPCGGQQQVRRRAIRAKY